MGIRAYTSEVRSWPVPEDMPRSNSKHSNVLSLFLATLLPLAASLTMSCAAGAGSGGSQPDGGSAITIDPARHRRLGGKLEQEDTGHRRLDRQPDRSALVDRTRFRLWFVFVSKRERRGPADRRRPEPAEALAQ